jgi:UDP-N-acetylmuramoyl-L-alanyl-D-glutamate--2,6-diaminopimelate ligase
MKFSALMERVKGCGVMVEEVCVGSGEDPEVRGICEDSRKVKAGDVFVARGGTKVDGAKFVADAVAKGAVAVVGENGKLKIENSKNVAWAAVGDVNLACALMAHEVAGNPTCGIKMIGVTGTKGKTTVAYLLRSVLKAAGFKVGMIGTVEIDDGEKTVPAEMTTPGSVELVGLFSRMKANGVTHCVMEVSSHALHQHRVGGIDWAVAIFTNLTGDHLDYHGTMEEYAAAKAMMFAGLKEGAVAVVNGDDKWVGKMVEGCKAHVVSFRVPEEQWDPGPAKKIDLGIVSIGLGGRKPPKDLPVGQWEARIEEMSPGYMSVWIVGHELRTQLPSLLIGRHNASNLVATIAACRELGVDPVVIWRALKYAQGAPGRLQRVFTEDGLGPRIDVFVDYAHTHDALENVLTALRATMGKSGLPPEDGTTNPPKGGTPNGAANGRLICMFGCGGDRDRTKRPKMGAIAERLADVVIVTNDNPRTESPAAIIEEICAGFSAEVRKALAVGGGQDARVTIEPDRRAAIKKAIGMAWAGDVVLLAGKGHENYQIVGTTKQHFDDVEEAEAALREKMTNDK